MFFPFLDLMVGFLKSYNPSFPSIPTSGPPKRSLAFPSGLKRHLGREEAFKEGKGIQGGKRHSGREIFEFNFQIFQKFSKRIYFQNVTYTLTFLTYTSTFSTKTSTFFHQTSVWSTYIC